MIRVDISEERSFHFYSFVRLIVCFVLFCFVCLFFQNHCKHMFSFLFFVEGKFSLLYNQIMLIFESVLCVQCKNEIFCSKVRDNVTVNLFCSYQGYWIHKYHPEFFYTSSLKNTYRNYELHFFKEKSNKHLYFLR